jgi:twitching motility protein PilT
MQEFSISGPKREVALEALRQSPLFGSLPAAELDVVLTHCQWVDYEPKEAIVREGEPAEHFFLLLKGDAEITVSHTTLDDLVEVGHIQPQGVFGEMALLLNHPRTATVQAIEPTTTLRFTKDAFHMMMDRVKGFARQVSTSLATRLAQTSRRVPLPQASPEALVSIDPETIRMLPSPFMFRHRVIPIEFEEGVIKLGFVDDPTSQIVNTIRRMLPSVQIRPFRINSENFDEIMRTYGFSDTFSGEHASAAEVPQENDVVVGSVVMESPSSIMALEPDEIKQRLAKIAPLLQRMVAEGASDLHMSAGQKPRWRINGDMYQIEDCRPLGRNEVEDLLASIMPVSTRKEFRDNLQVDFAYTMPGVGRFRVNLFYDDKGSGAVMRHIPSVIPTSQQLRLPAVMRDMVQLNQGLILVTGPTGSGKSTTLASLIEEINKTQPKHIITLEDPIEFVYESKKSLVNQRQIGTNARSFSMGLRAALREDPDIVLVGEMRDVETMMLAIETANTGHLVLGTLHTRGTISSIERIIDMFPADLQSQVRTSLSDLLQCVVSQVLCKRKGGGRVAAFELLTMNPAAANLIRQNKTHQLNTILTTQKPNMPMNASLEHLFKKGEIDYKEALKRSPDREDLGQRLGRRAKIPTSYSSSQLPAAGGLGTGTGSDGPKLRMKSQSAGKEEPEKLSGLARLAAQKKES